MADESRESVGEEMERWLRGLEGFEGFRLLTRPGETLGVAFWASREVAQRRTPCGRSSANECSRSWA